MKKNIVYILSAMFALYSCSEREEIIQEPEAEPGESRIEAITSGFNVSLDSEDNLATPTDVKNAMNTTRASLDLSNNTLGSSLVFHWTRGDRITVFSTMTTSRSKQTYYLNEEDAGKTAASFSSADFQITSDYNYYAFFPDALANNKNKDDIMLDYEGQQQVENNSTAHLAAYNYLASYQTPNGSQVSFDFKHISSPMHIQMAIPVRGTFYSFEILRADGDPIKYKRILDLTEGGDTGDDYKPKTYPNEEDEGQHGFLLKLGESDPGNPGKTLGIEAGHATNSTADENLLKMWIMFPKTNEFVGTDLIGKLIGKDSEDNEIVYYITFKGYEITDNYKYFRKRAQESTKLNISLRVHKLWQVGNTQSQTRAGDPGVDSELKVPSYIYLYVCKNDKLIKKIPQETNETDWEDEGDLWKYKTNIATELGSEVLDDDKFVHVYAIASYNSIYTTTPIPDALTENSENGIKNMAYQFPTVNDNLDREFGHHPATDADKELYFKNIYVNDYKLGKGDDMIMPITLYHACAKVDVQWNNKTNTALTGNVSVDNVPTSGLMLFQPTTNTSTSELWTPRKAITPGTCWNGRAVFYVPQMNDKTYSITTGDGHQQNVIFTAPTNVKLTGSDYAKTAWLKANITVE